MTKENFEQAKILYHQKSVMEGCLILLQNWSKGEGVPIEISGTCLHLPHNLATELIRIYEHDIANITAEIEKL